MNSDISVFQKECLLHLHGKSPHRPKATEGRRSFFRPCPQLSQEEAQTLSLACYAGDYHSGESSKPVLL